MSETVWLLKKTPQQRNKPTATHAYYDEDLARTAARTWSRRGWNTAVDSIEIHTEIPQSSKPVDLEDNNDDE